MIFALIAAFCLLLSLPVCAQTQNTIEHVTAPEWAAATRACQQHPEHSGCDALKSRYAVVQPRVTTQLRTRQMSVAKNPDPSVIDKVMGATEHMAFDKSFGFMEPETVKTMPEKLTK